MSGLEKTTRSAVVVVVDRLGAGFLGPYGNTWLETPFWNEMADQSVLFEQAITDSPDLARIYRSYWQGVHAAAVESTCEPLASRLQSVGLATHLVTDEQVIADYASTTGFQKRKILDHSMATKSVSEIEESQLVQLVMTSLETARSMETGGLLWIHSRGMDGPWDAPIWMRNQFAEEEDPEPPGFVEPPDRVVSPDIDPDELLGVVHAYAGQVALLDECMNILFEELAIHSWFKDTLIVLTSPRGFPLGEHGRLGSCDSALFEELIHVPWLMKLPDGAGVANRVHKFIQPADLYSTLLDWFNAGDLPSTNAAGRSLLPARQDRWPTSRDWAFALTDNQRVLRTSIWSARISDENSTAELYVKPDDRWEVNDVALRLPEMVEMVDEVAQDCQKWLSNNDHSLPPNLGELAEPV